MGYIREPEGVDFVIAPSPNTEKDIACISAYIQANKAKTKANKCKRKPEKSGDLIKLCR
ncbi:MAG: hypothetical protein LBT78_08645 [Tannerella sp.]|jgi:hypothetical protein|nr:hypothetical protein [Tannerella sp.]